MSRKEALEYIVDLIDPQKTIEIEGVSYSTKKLVKIQEEEPTPKPLDVSTLIGLDNLIQSEPEIKEKPLIALIDNHNTVRLLSVVFGKLKQRALYAKAETVAEPYPFGTKLTLEDFVVAVQSQFVQDDLTKRILAIVGTMSHEAMTKVEDDGVTQTVSAREGIVRNAEVQLPNPVSLSPYRTFREVEQPASNFVLRITNEAMPKIALHEADGGAWKIEAVQNIKDWLQDNLPNNVSVVG